MLGVISSLAIFRSGSRTAHISKRGSPADKRGSLVGKEEQLWVQGLQALKREQWTQQTRVLAFTELIILEVRRERNNKQYQHANYVVCQKMVSAMGEKGRSSGSIRGFWELVRLTRVVVRLARVSLVRRWNFSEDLKRYRNSWNKGPDVDMSLVLEESKEGSATEAEWVRGTRERETVSINRGQFL